QPVQPHVLYPAADVDRLVHAPDLIDVAHEIGVVADRLAHAPDPVDFLHGAGVAAELGLHLAEAQLLEPGAGLDDVIERKGAHQSAARIGGNARTEAARQSPDRLIQGLALDVPEGDV